MKTVRLYKTLADPSSYPIGSTHPIGGHIWQVVHAAPYEDAIDEDEIMTLRGPTLYRVEFQRVR